MIQPNTQKFISPFVAQQFPAFYDGLGPVFVQFVKSYYKWAETEGFLKDSRNIDEYLDIDTTIQDYIVYFKDKYLPNIQLNTASNTKLLIKHSLDIYRTRGTIRAIDLLFRLVFAKGAQVYYPWDDVFRTSPNNWVIPQYLEVSKTNNLNLFVGKQIVGNDSGATAFVEGWTRKKKNSKTIHLFYVSSKVGEFQTGELINLSNNPIALRDCPSMVGSLSSVSLLTSDIGSKLGDVVEISGDSGYGAEGLVSKVANVTGLVSFALIDGGYGYTDSAEILISNNVLFLSNVNSGSSDLGMFSLFETVSQPTATLSYTGNGNFQNNDSIFIWTNSAITAQGLVLSSNIGNSTAGSITLYISNGTFSNGATILSAGNTVGANITLYSNTTATGNLIAESRSFQADITDFNGSFRISERITQPGGASAILSYSALTGGIGTFYASNRIGVWKANTLVTGQGSHTTAKITNIHMDVGIISPTNAFIIDPRALLRGSVSNTTASITRVSTGSSANVSFSNALLFEETVNINTDMLSDYNDVELAANAYGFPADPTANQESEIFGTLTFNTYNIGRLQAISSFSHGEDYSAAPYVRIYEPAIFSTKVPAIIDLNLDVSASGFQGNEIISQDSTNALGMVVSSSGNTLIVRRLSFNNDFVSNDSIFGESSGASGNIIAKFDAPQNSQSLDLGEYYMGLSAVVNTQVVLGNGSITEVQVTSSGYGFEENENIIFKSPSNNAILATGLAHLKSSGTGKGFFRTKDGFLSSDKKLQDSYYYQVASYEVRSAIPFETYSDMLYKLLHQAGTKPFGAFYYDSLATMNATISSSINKTVYTARSLGIANGTSLAFANATSTAASDFSGNGIANVSGVGIEIRDYANGVATASGTSTTDFAGTLITEMVANTDGTSTAFGNGMEVNLAEGDGTANGTSTALAISG
jgi:hypothetical protein